MSKKILVIDDDPVTVRLLESRLHANGYGVITATNGVEGLQKAQADSPDLITLDVMMPELNGYSVCGFLKTHEKYRGIPIIMLTIRDKKEDREFDDAVRPEAYLTKPFEMQCLLEKIRELIEKNK